jgi:hypothetical protein
MYKLVDAVWPFLAALATAVFITLKLTGVIAWRWVWVLAPLWGGIAVYILEMAIVGFFVSVMLDDLKRAGLFNWKPKVWGHGEGESPRGNPGCTPRSGTGSSRPSD